MRTTGLLLALGLCGLACTRSSGGASTDGGVGDAGHPDGGPSDAGPHVVVDGGVLLIDGVPTYLYGGEVHYFRVRDPARDPVATQALWDDTLDRMVQAGMNVVTTYAPWDWHNPEDGVWDFEGAKDLGAFLDKACTRGLWVILKPGPFITAEWPDGFGSYGAVPAWWKAANPDSLAKNSTGGLYDYSPLGNITQRQPSYFDPAFQSAVRNWYHQVLTVARPHLRGCLIGLQIDNETNLYWANHYGDADYSPTALATWHAWLKGKYGTIDSLNAQYQTAWTSFDQVTAPAVSPSDIDTERPHNPWFYDWYAGGLASVGNYLATLRGYLRSEGFEEPDVLFFTNDSPFALQSGLLLIHDVLLHDHATKLPYGVPGLDLYPKQSSSPALQDQPFQADYFVRYSDEYPAAGQSHAGYPYAAELQGGFFAPFGTAAPPVLPEATDQLLLRAAGRGLKGGSFYVLRGGINADNSDYDYQAAIGLDGGVRPRWGVMEKWATFFKAYGADLLSAHPVQPAVAILTNARYAAPQGGIADEMQLLHTAEEPALFGWLANAGLDPAVLEAQAISGSDLAKYKVIFYQNPDYIDDTTANLLSAFVAQGGLLINLLWPGAASADFRTSPAQLAYQGLWSTAPDGRYHTWLPYSATGTGPLNLSFGAETLSLTSYWYETFWQLPAGAVPFAWEQLARGQANGRVVGYLLRDGKGTRAFLGTNVYSIFNRGDYYKMPVAEVAALTRLARWLVQPSGVAPIVKTDTAQVLAWPRRSASGRIFIFVVNDGAARTANISINVTAIGLSPAQGYQLREALGGVDLGAATGAALGTAGVTLSLPQWGTAVVVVEPTPP